MLAKRLFIHACPNNNHCWILPVYMDLVWNESSKSTYWEFLKIEFADFGECIWRLQIVPFEERFSQNSSHSFSDVDAVPTEVGIWISTWLSFKQDSIYISTRSTPNFSEYVIFPSSSSTTSLYCLIEPYECKREGSRKHMSTRIVWLWWVSMYVARTLDSGGNEDLDMPILWANTL